MGFSKGFSGYFKDDSEFEQALQKVEGIMQEVGLKFTALGVMIVSFNGKEARLADIESGESTSNIPRELESEKLVVSDN